jgi:catechol 2,3-dioxygenase-like lactoylglutathione lyase family enzyme
MAVHKLAHFSIRTTALADSVRFYTRVLGLREGWRPPFAFPGAWLYAGGDTPDDAVIHLIGVEDGQGLRDYLGTRDEAALRGGAAVDHLAFSASDLEGMRTRLRGAGLPFRERTVPGLGLHQLFCEDPSGVVIELNFAASEAAPQ